MKLDDLRDIQTRERTTNSLQELPDSFYADVADYVQGLKNQRQAEAEEADDPFSSPEVSRLTDEIQMAEQVAEAIYERRVGKIVKQASLAAADMQSDDTGLTAEERALYDDLVARIEQNKGRILDVLAGEDGGAADTSSTATTRARSDSTPGSSEPEPRDRPDGVSAADAMGDGATSESASTTADAQTAHADASGSAETGAGGEDARRESAGGRPAPPEPAQEAPDDGDAAASDEPRTTVRITRDVGEIFGVDERVYTLESNDVVSLPEANVTPLVEKEAAERLQ